MLPLRRPCRDPRRTLGPGRARTPILSVPRLEPVHRRLTRWPPTNLGADGTRLAPDTWARARRVPRINLTQAAAIARRANNVEVDRLDGVVDAVLGANPLPDPTSFLDHDPVRRRLDERVGDVVAAQRGHARADAELGHAQSPEVLVAEPRLDECRDAGTQRGASRARAAVVHRRLDIGEEPCVRHLVDAVA